MEQRVDIREADLNSADDQAAVVMLTSAYAMDPMGNNGPLPAVALDKLISGLKAHPTTLILLAFVDDRAVGIATCFTGFSTFRARPLLNIHDLSVMPEHRGRGVGRALMQAVEDRARARGCCKVTLEVRENNSAAMRVYERAGFAQDGLGEDPGGALFYSKQL